MSTTPLTDALRETLDLFDGPNRGTPLTTTDVADRLDLGRRATYERLDRLVDRELLRTKKVGARARVWWRPPEWPADAVETPASADASEGFESAAGGEGTESADADDGSGVTSAAGESDSAEVGDPADSAASRSRLEKYERVLETVSDGVYTVDADGRFTMVNRAYAELTGYDREELLGAHVSTVVDEDAVETARTVQEELSAGEREAATFEADVHTADGETLRAEGSFTLLREDSDADERIGVVRDVTERAAHERQLERYETIVETVEDGVYVLDEAYRFVLVNDAYAEMTGYDREELLGSHCSLVVGEDVSAAVAERSQALAAGAGDHATVEAEIERADGDRLPAESRFTPLASDDGGFRGTVGVVRDLTERHERRRELERYAAIIDAVGEPAYELDRAGRFTFVNEPMVERSGYSEAELLGAHASVGMDDEAVARAQSRIAAHLAEGGEGTLTLEYEVVTKDGECLPAENRLSLRTDEDGRFLGSVGVIWDVSDRVERERTLEKRVRQQQVVTALGRRALEERDIDALMADAAALVADALGTDYCGVLDLDAAAEALRLRQGVGWRDGLVGGATVPTARTDVQEATALRSEAPVVATDLRAESRLAASDLAAGHDVRSGISTTIGPVDEPWGVLGAYDAAPTAFSEYDVNFVQSVANILAEAIALHREDQELLRQREQLTALNNLNEVVHNITDAVIDQSTRAEIETIVCEQLAASESYRFAWVGEVDVHEKRVTLRAESGIEGSLDDVTISVDPSDERSRGPTGRAILERRTQVSRDSRADTRYEPWREHVREHGYRSFASIPIVHEEVLHGVLNVYADRVNAFAAEERAVLSQLGEVVGHAIAALGRKQALMSDEVVELEYLIADAFEAYDVLETEGVITFDRTVHLGDGQSLQYGTATGDAMEAVEAAVAAETLPHWRSVRAVESAFGETRFELTMTEAPVTAVVAEQGGHIKEARLEDGDYFMRIHLAPSADVRSVVSRIEEVYPGITLVTQRQVARERETIGMIRERLQDEFTERQRTAIETAYSAGYFEWPRTSSGEELAASLGVSAPTFHQHLRKAEKKVFGAVFADELAAG